MSEIVNPEYPILGFLRLKAGIIGRPIRETHGTIVDRIAAASGVIRVANGFRCPDDREFAGTFTDASGSTCGLRIARGAMESPADIVARGLRQRNMASGTRRRVTVPDNPAFHGVGVELPNGFGNPAWGNVRNHFAAYGQTVRGTPISWRDERIPSTVFHVTTANRAVRREGLLRASGQGGLGGDSADRIVSMTIDRATAEQIKEDMLLAFDIARAVDVDEAIDLILEDAKKYGLSDDPRMSSLLERLASSAGRYDDSDKQLASVLNEYLWARDTWGGPKNPLFVGLSDTLASLRIRDREDIDVVDIPKERLDTGAMLVDFDMSRGDGGLGEIRLYGDITLDGEDDLQSSVDQRIEATNQAVKAIYEQDGILFDGVTGDYVEKVADWRDSGVANNYFGFDVVTSAERRKKIQEEVDKALLLVRQNPDYLKYLPSNISPQVASDILYSDFDALRAQLEYAAFGLYSEHQSAEVRVRMKASSFILLLESGIYKTTHSGGNLPMSFADARKEYETSIGIAPNVPNEVRPVSGYSLTSTALEQMTRSRRTAGGRVTLTKDDLPVLAGYGSIDLVLHDSVKGRSGITAGDSLNTKSQPVSYGRQASTDEVTNAMLAPIGNMARGTYALEFIGRLLDGEYKNDYSNIGIAKPYSNNSMTDPYMEVMIAGGIDIEDVKEIIIPYAEVESIVFNNARVLSSRTAEELTNEHFSIEDLRSAGLTDSEIEVALWSLPYMVAGAAAGEGANKEINDYLFAMKAAEIMERVQTLSPTTQVSFSSDNGEDPLDPLLYGLPINAPLIPGLKTRAFDKIVSVARKQIEDGFTPPKPTSTNRSDRIVG